MKLWNKNINKPQLHNHQGRS